MIVLLASLLTGQAPAPEPAAPPAALTHESGHDAYRAGAYDQALARFLDQQIERPDDPELAMSVGSAHYQMRNFDEAGKAFSAAALRGDPKVRARALYNLGNVAYRRGALDEAIQHYQAALDLDPNDADAKFNLEFVRDEIRRRHEEAQKRQQQQQQQQQQNQQPQDQQQQGEQRRQGSPDEQQEQRQGQPQGAKPDKDGDGLPDEIETGAQNKTDPNRPDTDGDGLADGREDTNANGVVDPGETDPNKKDSDGDGVPDADDTPSQGAEHQGAAATPQPDPSGKMTPDEAARYLRGIEEGRPDQKHRVRGRQARPEKDW